MMKIQLLGHKQYRYHYGRWSLHTLASEQAYRYYFAEQGFSASLPYSLRKLSHIVVKRTALGKVRDPLLSSQFERSQSHLVPNS